MELTRWWRSFRAILEDPTKNNTAVVNELRALPFFPNRPWTAVAAPAAEDVPSSQGAAWAEAAVLQRMLSDAEVRPVGERPRRLGLRQTPSRAAVQKEKGRVIRENATLREQRAELLRQLKRWALAPTT